MRRAWLNLVLAATFAASGCSDRGTPNTDVTPTKTDGPKKKPDAIDCSLVGCAAPPPCGQPCTAPCGCCSGPTCFDSGIPDHWVYCTQPPSLAECIPPPSSYSLDKVHCLGCNCVGPSAAAACNGTSGDCRYFNDGCFPKSYTRCDQNAPQFILGLCGYCFFREAGIPKECNHLLSDAGVKPKG